MLYIKSIHTVIGMLLSLSLLANGCSMLTPTQKPEIGPLGIPAATKDNPPITQFFAPPPKELYDLEVAAGLIFEGIVKNNWSQAQDNLYKLYRSWLQAKNIIGDKKGAKDADEAIERLGTSIGQEKGMDSYENLTTFMASIVDISKSYKLSPLSDIISVANSIRTVSFYVANKDWHKAAAKMKELDSNWSQVKPSMESVGIFGKITTLHSTVKQLKNAIDTENKASAEEYLIIINENLGSIREYYHNK